MSSSALPFDPKDTLADAKRRKRVRGAERRDREYLAHVGSLPCLVCARVPVEVHHQPYKSDRTNWHDHKTAPLCSIHHRVLDPRYSVSIHALGLAGFNAKYHLDLEAEVARIRREFTQGVQHADARSLRP